MITISNICKNSYTSSYLLLQAKAKKKNTPKHKAMNHFDDFYGSVFGEKWAPMREALLKRSKYVAVVNNYGDTEETIENLTKKGAHCLKNLISIQEQFTKQYNPLPDLPLSTNNTDKLKEYTEKLHADEVSQFYPQSGHAPDKIDFTEAERPQEAKKINEEIVPSKMNLNQSLKEAVMDESRIIDPSMGMTTDLLYQFLPATKLKGMEEWIPESIHYSYYSKDQDFPLVIEPETELIYPDHLKVYTYEMGSELTMFPEPKRCSTGVFNYYPMDCGSVLAVLALGLRPGDRVLDLCSSPGGKALVALQTLLPDVIVCNDVSFSRSNRTVRIFKDYLCDFETSNKWRERVIINRIDGRSFTDDQGFDKVLVDVPCTTDRHTVNEDENNIFRPDRIKERLKIPELQAQLLLNGLRLTKVGGTVVYSTCSLSPIQNDGVVHSALKQAFENHSVVATIKWVNLLGHKTVGFRGEGEAEVKTRDMTRSMSGLSSTVQLGTESAAPKYGQLVTPCGDANFGPTYIAKLTRVK